MRNQQLEQRRVDAFDTSVNKPILIARSTICESTLKELCKERRPRMQQRTMSL
jgi:hypothetical protein